MNKSYPVQVGSVAFVRCSDEVVFVVRPVNDDELAYVVRRKEGEGYTEDTFLVGELVTPQQRIIDDLDLQLFANRLRREYQASWDKENKPKAPTIDLPMPVMGGGGFTN
jgi:hypothetical protein